MPVPVARLLRREEIESDYEGATGDILLEAIGPGGIAQVPAVLAPGHGPFVWGSSAADAVEKAATLEEVAKMALFTRLVDPGATPLDPVVRDKHFNRKHGPGAYYGQSH